MGVSNVSSERVQAGVGHQGRGYQVPVAYGSDEERELETVFIDTGYIARCYPTSSEMRPSGVIEKIPYGEQVYWCHRMVVTRKHNGTNRRENCGSIVSE